MSRVLAGGLIKLYRSSGSVPVSQFTDAQRGALDDYGRQTGAIHSAVSGRGRVYEVVRRTGIELKLKELRPGAIEDIDASLPFRAQNIALSRSSKAGRRRHQSGYLLIKNAGITALWQSQTQGRMDVAKQCNIGGVSALQISPQDDWFTTEPLWLVENQALFDDLSWIPAGTRGSVIYYAGQLSNLQLEWFRHRCRASQIVHFPDYDGVGLLNYARLAKVSTCPVDFWLIPGWEELLQRYGNAELWQKTRSQFNSAKGAISEEKGSASAELTLLMDKMIQAGLALEHEAVWLAAD